MNRLLTAFATIALAGGVIAQDEPAPEAQPEPTLIEVAPAAVTFADAEMEKAAAMLTGTWVGTAPIDDANDDVMVMAVAPVVLDGVEHALYVELARSSELGTPFRQVIMQLYRYEDKLRLRTLEFKDAVYLPTLIGLAYATDRFPEFLPTDRFYATLDIELSATGDGFAGSTPYPYPTMESDAVQMSSSIQITPDTLVTGDTGFAADGSVLWGGDGSATTTFERSDDHVKIDRWSDDLVVIRFDDGEGEPVREGDTLAIHYTGYLTSGTTFDSSLPRDMPLEYKVPGRLIDGWLRATEDIKQGAVYRAIIPPELGYGSRGNPRIPANSTLLFDIECVYINRAEDEAEAEQAPAEQPTDE
ncbi:MAG: CpcT/CpeT family chromophore lyase [Planctomycetota bacterium]